MKLPKAFSGKVVPGFGRGSKLLGFATANLDETSWDLKLSEDDYGVYSGWVTLRKEPRRMCVLSIGKAHTFDVDKPTFEVHILDFDEDIYGIKLEVEITHLLRPMMTFNSAQELKAQITSDVKKARGLLGAANKDG